MTDTIDMPQPGARRRRGHRPASSYRGARRNALRASGNIRGWRAAGRQAFYEQQRGILYRNVWDSVANRLRGAARWLGHKHLRQIARQGRNNPTAARVTIAELDGATL